MNVSFIGGTYFKRDHSEDSLAMLALLHKLDFGPVNFYFLNDNQFSKLAYKHCKDYKKITPESKLIYVADPSKKENIKEGKYDLIVYPEKGTAPPHLSVQEKYAIEHSDFVIIYDKDGLEGNISSFYTLFLEKKLLDFRAYLNQSKFFIHTTVCITDDLIRNYDKNITEPHEFAKNIFSYLHIHQELLKTNLDYIFIYQAALAYLFKRHFKQMHISQYDSIKSKEALFAATDLYCQKHVEEKAFLFDENEIIRFSQYCQSQDK